ncbi:MAG: hypothetical protein U5R31_08950 [Acidimicrobiia bacterium]|nr:hypothetical protein [Acidimicrobiia bacterium]
MLVSLQIFLLTVAVEGLLADEDPLACGHGGTLGVPLPARTRLRTTAATWLTRPRSPPTGTPTGRPLTGRQAGAR